MELVNITDITDKILLDIRYYSGYNFVGERIDGYHKPLALLTREALDALIKANEDLMAKGFCLKIYDAYRPVKSVNHFVRWARDIEDIRMKDIFYPDIDKNKLFELGYIADKSSHSRGSTVDVTMFDLKNGKDADMGSLFDFFGEISHPSYRRITIDQYNNRKMLQYFMVKNGFEPLDTEWWHFTLKNEPYPDTYFDYDVE